jgi:hypothetical protein
MTGIGPEVHGNAVDYVLVFSDKNLAPMPWPRDLKGVARHYREMTVVPVDVPFEFKDVPLL